MEKIFEDINLDKQRLPTFLTKLLKQKNLDILTYTPDNNYPLQKKTQTVLNFIKINRVCRSLLCK